jgi:nitrous oxidase accessory protein NosD
VAGIVVRGSAAKTLVEQCRFSDTSFFALCADAAKEVEIRHCIFGPQSNILVDQGSHVRVSHCENGKFLASKSRLEICDSTFKNASEKCVIFGKKSVGKIEASTFENCQVCIFICQQKKKDIEAVRIRGCEFRRNQICVSKPLRKQNLGSLASLI